MHRAYTFYDIEFQVGMRDPAQCLQYEKWLVDKFTGHSEFALERPDGYHVTKSIDFRNKPHLSYDYVGPDGKKIILHVKPRFRILSPWQMLTEIMSDEEYDQIFTTNKPIIFNFHGYPSLIHQLTYKRKNRNLHVHGYKEEGTITTTFDIRVQNEIDRFHLVMAVIREIPRYSKTSKVLVEWCNDMLKKHKAYIAEYGEDMPYIRNWKWNK